MPILFSDEPNELVNTSRTAFLAAMLLDQQVPITWAFAGPQRLVDRLGIEFTPAVIADLDESALLAAAAEPPAIHRYHKTMARRLQDLCRFIVDEWDGDTDALLDAPNGRTLHRRLSELPGFGDEKVKITIAALAKRLDAPVKGWKSAAAPFGDTRPRSVADIGSAADLVKVRAWKKAQREAGLSKQDKTAKKPMT